VSKIQKQDVKTEAELISAGATISSAIGTDQLYDVTNSQKLSDAIAAGKPMTTSGDIIYRNGSVAARLGIGTAGQVLTVAGGLPSWAAGGGGGSGDFTSPTVKSSNYTIVSGDNKKVILVDCSSSAIEITLPAPAADFFITIKDYKGFSESNNITVKRNGSEKIDFAASDEILSASYISTSYLSDGTDWFRVSFFDGVIPSTLSRGLFAGGNTGSRVNTIDYIDITTASNATDFGDLFETRDRLSGLANSTRGLFAGGYTGSADSNTIDYVTIATTGNASDFGNLTVARRGSPAGVSNGTRGCWGGGDTGSYQNVIDYVEIATTGNATDFGDLTVSRADLAGCSSTTRGLFAGGDPSNSNVIDYITLATVGNATDFGDLTVGRYRLAACSSSTRGLFGGGRNAGTLDTIDYVTIATTSNATDFGDLATGRHSLTACSSKLRGVFSGGFNGGVLNQIEYVTIASTGNATDFGDLTQAREGLGGCSNTHGGL